MKFKNVSYATLEYEAVCFSCRILESLKFPDRSFLLKSKQMTSSLLCSKWCLSVTNESEKPKVQSKRRAAVFDYGSP